MKIIATSLMLLISTAAYADVLRPECQTEETRGLRFTSVAMAKAAEESDPWQGCNNCTMQSSIADDMTRTKRRFEAESRAALLKARALEAAHCPQWADAIMANGPVTEEEKQEVATEFKRRMDKEWQEYRDQLAWQAAHPQCEHVVWWKSLGASINGQPVETEKGSVQDLSGHFKGKAGDCSVDADGPAYHGGADDLTMYNPDTNERIAQTACGSALAKFKFGDGWWADPKLCSQ